MTGDLVLERYGNLKDSRPIGQVKKKVRDAVAQPDIAGKEKAIDESWGGCRWKLAGRRERDCCARNNIAQRAIGL